MNDLRQKALRLRLQGKSYNEITQALGVPKSTLSGWLQDIVLSESARQRLLGRVRQGTLNGLVKRNVAQTRKAWNTAQEIQKAAIKSVPVLAKKDLLIIGVALYWAEGFKRLQVRNGKDRSSHPISFVNSDPDMARTFVRFLTEVLEIPVERIRMCVRLYKHINEQESIKYWQRITSLPDSCVRNTTYLVSRASKGRRPFNRLPYGTLQIWVGDTKKFHHLLGLIEGMKRQL